MFIENHLLIEVKIKSKFQMSINSSKNVKIDGIIYSLLHN